MSNKIPAEVLAHYPEHFAELARRYNEVLDAAKFDWLLVLSGSLLTHYDDDHHYPFVVNPQFKVLLPEVQAPDCCVLWRLDKKPLLYFFSPSDYWHASPQLPEGPWQQYFDIEIVTEGINLDDICRSQAGHGAILGQCGEGAVTGSVDVNPPGLINQLNWQRSIKTPYEIACLRAASDIAVAGHCVAFEAFRNRACEFDIHQAYLRETQLLDEELPYGNIIALNEHAAVLHYTKRERRAPLVSRSFLIDAGASYRGYASDITRTYAAGDGLFNDLIGLMEKEQQAMVAGLRVGDYFTGHHQRAHEAIARVLIESRIFTGSVDSALDQGVTRAFFPHGLGHFLGLQVHDVGGRQAGPAGGVVNPPEDYPALRTTRQLAAGQVITVEPGLYFIDSLLEALRVTAISSSVNWSLVEELRPYGGIRIEDNIVIASQEPENLTRDAFKRREK